MVDVEQTIEAMVLLAIVTGGVFLAVRTLFAPARPVGRSRAQRAAAANPAAHIGAAPAGAGTPPAAAVAPPGLSRNPFAGLDGDDGDGVNLEAFTATLPAQPPPPAVAPVPRDPDYEATEGVRDVLEALDAGAPAVLVYGGAGVGKSHLVRYLRALPGSDTTVVVAPTAIAALTSGGQTIHSFFQFPPQVLDPRNLDGFRGADDQLWKRMTRLVVDEISMVRADLVDSMHARLRQLRGIDKAFGGVQVILVGDPLQLPPVVKSKDRQLLNAMGYKSPLLYGGHIWPFVKGMCAVELTKVYRQTERDFIAALDDIRRCRNLNGACDFLNERCFRPHRDGVTPVLLMPTRGAASAYNDDRLAELPGPDATFIGTATAGFKVQDDKLPAPQMLRLKVGAEVMSVINDPQGRWINGSRGRVEALQPASALVRFHGNGQTHQVDRWSWEKVEQSWDPATARIINTPSGAYSQLPLIPGWALTIHKAQGMTLDDVRVDLDQGAFTPGQVYVAVSRARTLGGLSLAKKLTSMSVTPDAQVQAFMSWLDTRRG